MFTFWCNFYLLIDFYLWKLWFWKGRWSLQYGKTGLDKKISIHWTYQPTILTQTTSFISTKTIHHSSTNHPWSKVLMPSPFPSILAKVQAHDLLSVYRWSKRTHHSYTPPSWPSLSRPGCVFFRVFFWGVVTGNIKPTFHSWDPDPINNPGDNSAF